VIDAEFSESKLFTSPLVGEVSARAGRGDGAEAGEELV
jgi:hypothetical protein